MSSYKKTIGVIAAIAVTAILICAYILVFMNSGRVYFYSVLNKTKTAYANEIAILIDNNRALKEIESIITDSYTQQFNLYTDSALRLIGMADYKKEKSTAEIGGKTVKTDVITFTATAETTSKWLDEDFLLAVKSDTILRKYASIFRNFVDMDRVIKNLATDIENRHRDLVLKMTVYSGVIVSVELSLHSDDAHGDIGFKVSALGSEYRLNDIMAECYDQERGIQPYIRFAGNHIGSDVFTSTIETASREIYVEWAARDIINFLNIINLQFAFNPK